MAKGPILREIPSALVNGKYQRREAAVGGLHYIKGNRLPYFSLTYEAHDTGGCCHDEILARWPELKPLADLHLSDINGEPMHGAVNGWYWLTGAVPLLTKAHKTNPAEGRYGKSPEECFRIFCEHVRVSPGKAKEVIDLVMTPALALNAYDRVWGGPKLAEVVKECKDNFTLWVASQRPRWKAEADAAIKEFGLVVYGDKWQEAA